MRIFLNGGGDGYTVKEAYEIFSSVIDHNKPLLYIPLAMNSDKYDECYNWITKELSKYSINNIYMVRSSLELSQINLYDYSSIFIGGGNTFKLLKELKDNNNYNKIKDYIDNNGIIYGGSAGSIIFGKDLLSCKLDDNNDVGLQDINGFNVLNNISILCHYTNRDNIKTKESTNYLLELSKTNKVLALPEEDTLYINDNNIQIIGNKSYYIFDKGVKKVLNNRPITTLFMLESLDGKINSGSSDELDVDRDWCNIDGVKEGLYQYYDIESNTDLYSLNSGRVMAKIGINSKTNIPNKIPCSFIIIDNKPHLDENGIDYLCKWVNTLYLVTTNKNHIVYNIKDKYDNLVIMEYDELDLNKLLVDLKEKYNVDRLTIQSGGSLNELFLRNDLIDYVNIVIAPILVGGKDTPTLIDGNSITSVTELDNLKSLELIECNKLNNSYVQLKYKVFRKNIT